MWVEFLTAVGLVFVIEGLIWALFPGLFLKLAVLAAEIPLSQFRASGVFAIAIGVLIVWLVKG